MYFFALPESISSARVLQQPGPRGLRFSHRGRCETLATREWLVTKRKGSLERENTAFPCAQISLRETLLGTGTRQVLQHFRARALTSINTFYGTGILRNLWITREKFRWKQLQMSTKMMLQKNLQTQCYGGR